MDRVVETATKLGLDDLTLQQIRLVVDEACANVVTHAYQGMEPGDMEITCSHSSCACTIQVRDWGHGFALECVPIPDLDCPLDERHLGGLGLFLIRHFMDHVHYTSDPAAGNVLTMTKKLPA